MRVIERRGLWLMKNTGFVFTSLRVVPIRDKECAEYEKPIELRSETKMIAVNETEFRDQFVRL